MTDHKAPHDKILLTPAKRRRLRRLRRRWYHLQQRRQNAPAASFGTLSAEMDALRREIAREMQDENQEARTG